MTILDAFHTLVLAVGYVSIAVTSALVSVALVIEAREWLDNHDRGRLIERRRDREDSEVAYLDDLWHLPTRTH